MWIIGVIVIGFLAGLIARAILPGKYGMGFLMTTGLGVVGAVVANFGGRALGLYGETDVAGLIGAVIGSIIVLLIYRMVKNKQATL